MKISHLSLINGFLQNPQNESILNEVSNVIASNSGKNLFRLLLNTSKANKEVKPSDYKKLLQFLEPIMDVKPYVAGYFMGRLYPKASDKKLHDVCDAIELWIYENRNKLKDALVKLADEGACRKVWMDWTTENNVKID